MYNYQQNGTQKDALREKAVYDKLLAKYEALLSAADEGVFQVTIHTDSGAITMPVAFASGRGIAIDLAEVLSDWIGKIESNLNYSLVCLGEETKEGRDAAERRADEQEAHLKAGRAAIAALYEAPALAQQAAATAAPAQRGRPRKAQPAVAQQLAVAASAVPMNGANQQPGGTATNLPQG